MWPAELVREGVHNVLYQGGDAGRLQPMPAYVADQKGDAAVLGLKDVVEVAAHLGLLGGGAIEMAKGHSGEFLGDVEQRPLQAQEQRTLLLQQTSGLDMGFLQQFMLGDQLFGLCVKLVLPSGQLIVLRL